MIPLSPAVPPPGAYFSYRLPELLSSAERAFLSVRRTQILIAYPKHVPEVAILTKELVEALNPPTRRLVKLFPLEWDLPTFLLAQPETTNRQALPPNIDILVSINPLAGHALKVHPPWWSTWFDRAYPDSLLIEVALPSLNQPTPSLAPLIGSRVWFPTRQEEPASLAGELADIIINLETYTRLAARTQVWDNRNRPEPLLLRHPDLKALNTWKQKLLEGETAYIRLEPLQETFIEASSQYVRALTQNKVHPPAKPGIFISYSRRNRFPFVEKLYETLKDYHLNPWIDWENIPVAADWRQEIQEAIQAAHTFIFVITPESVASHHCAEEIKMAAACNKRFIPVLRNRNFDMASLLEDIRRHQYVSFERDDIFEENFLILRAAINTDLDHVKFHTRLQERALEWNARNRNPDLLLRGHLLTEARNWLIKSTTKNPLPSSLQVEYLDISEQSARQEVLRATRFKWGAALLTVGILSMLPLLSAYYSFTAKVDVMLTSIGEPNEELDALLVAMQAGHRINGIRGWFAPDLRNKARVAIQRELYSLRELNRFEGHEGNVYDVLFTTNSNQLVTAGQDHQVIIWNLDQGTSIPLLGHQQPVIDIAMNDHSQLIASGSYDGHVKLWYPDGKLFKTLHKSHQGKIYGISFSNNGQLFASAGGADDGKGQVYLWKHGPSFPNLNPDSYYDYIELNHDAPVLTLSFSDDNQRLVTADARGVIKIWKTTGELIQTLDHGSTVLKVAFSPNGQKLVSAGYGEVIKLWDTETFAVQELRKHEGIVRQVIFNPDGQYLASGGEDGTIRIWDTNTGEMQHLLRGHQHDVTQIQFRPNNPDILVSAGIDGNIKLWLWQAETLIETLSSHQKDILELAFSPDGSVMASSSADGTARLWRLDLPYQSFPHDNQIFDVSFKPDGSLVATSGVRTVKVWDRQGHLKSTIPVSDGGIAAIDFDASGQFLVAGDSKGQISILQPGQSDKLLFQQKIYQGDISAVQFNQNSLIFAVAGKVQPTSPLAANSGTSIPGDYEASLWMFDPNTPTIQHLATLPHDKPVKALAFSQTGQYIITTTGEEILQPEDLQNFSRDEIENATEDGEIVIWEVKTMTSDSGQTPILNVQEHWRSSQMAHQVHQGDILSISIHPTEPIFAAAGEDGKISIWDFESNLKKIIPAHLGKINTIAYSLDGRLLASADQTGTVKVWDQASRLKSALKLHEQEISALEFSPLKLSNTAQYSFATASADEKLQVIELQDKTLPELLQEACYLVEDFADRKKHASPPNQEASRRLSQEIRSICEP